MELIRTLIYRSFIQEDRYLFFVEGLKNTLLLTIASFIIGTVFAVLLCAMLRSGSKGLKRIARGIMSFFMELPTMVLLMIMVYLIFGDSMMPVEIIVIIGLTVKTGSFLADVFNTALSTVSEGEIEAARTLGMNRIKTFKYITFPQAVDAALPLYQNQFVVSLQETSVVGYLAIIDLTRAASIVTSFTMDAFTGLFLITIIYFLIGSAGKGLFSLAVLSRRARHIYPEEESSYEQDDSGKLMADPSGTDFSTPVPEKGRSLISIKNMSKSYGDSAVLENVDLEIETGESIVIIGSSGCGKTTLLRSMDRLILPDSGSICFNGTDLTDKETDIDLMRRSIGMVYQQFNLFSHLSVIENVILAPVKVAGIDKSKAVSEARELLKKVGMAGRENAMPADLSGGQKQRVAIARALAMHPVVMLFDEPTSALDPTMVDEVESVISKLVADGMTSVIVTHEMQFARKVGSRILFMAEKGIYEQGTPDQIFNNPTKSLTQRFLFRSRIFEEKIHSASMDLYSLASNIRAFLTKYETGKKQDMLISVLCDELFYPVAKKGEPFEATLRMICSETRSHHVMHISFAGLSGDPLGETYIDEVNLKLLERACEFIFSSKKEDIWEVSIQM